MAAITKPPYLTCGACMTCGGYLCTIYQKYVENSTLSQLNREDSDKEENIGDTGPVTILTDTFNTSLLFNIKDKAEERAPLLLSNDQSFSKRDVLSFNDRKCRFIEKHFHIKLSDTMSITNSDLSDSQKDLLYKGICPKCDGKVSQFSLKGTEGVLSQKVFICKNTTGCNMALKVGA